MSAQEDCLFCRIVSGAIPSRQVYVDDDVIAFHDVNPQAPVHVLIVPKRVIPRLAESAATDAELLGRMLVASREVAQKVGIAESGYRMVINSGRDGGETVPHLHMHLLGGRHMTWPPG